MKHKVPSECIPARCVNGSCPIALRNEYGEASGVPYDFKCKDCYEHIEFCEDCRYINECDIISHTVVDDDEF